MLKQTAVLNAIVSEDYHVSLPLLSKGLKEKVAIRSNLRLLATLIRYGMVKTIHVSDRETLVVIASNDCRIGFFWKAMPKGSLLLTGIQNLDGYKQVNITKKVLEYSERTAA